MEGVGGSEGVGGGGGRMAQFSEAEQKRRKLEEDMRKEVEERRRKREELLRKETDIEQVTSWLLQCGGVGISCDCHMTAGDSSEAVV